MRHTTIQLLLLSALVACPALAGAAECLMGSMKGIPEADAETVADIICDAIRARGIDVAQPSFDARGGEAYRIDARPLGSKLFLTVTHVGTEGGNLARATLDVMAIEEVPVAAPRLAEMILDRKSADQTAKVSSLVGDETRQYQKKAGETLWGLGFSGIAVPGADVFPGMGLVFRGTFETEDFGIVGDLRITGGDKKAVIDQATIFSASINGRYFFLDGGWSPYIGGGLGWAALTLVNDDLDTSDSGMGGNVEFGFEFLRFYKSRLQVDFRVDLPFFDLRQPDESDWDWRTGQTTSRSGNRKYVTPMTFGVTYLWW